MGDRPAGVATRCASQIFSNNVLAIVGASRGAGALARSSPHVKCVSVVFHSLADVSKTAPALSAARLRWDLSGKTPVSEEGQTGSVLTRPSRRRTIPHLFGPDSLRNI